MEEISERAKAHPCYIPDSRLVVSFPLGFGVKQVCVLGSRQQPRSAQQVHPHHHHLCPHRRNRRSRRTKLACVAQGVVSLYYAFFFHFSTSSRHLMHHVGYCCRASRREGPHLCRGYCSKAYRKDGPNQCQGYASRAHASSSSDRVRNAHTILCIIRGRQQLLSTAGKERTVQPKS